MAVRTIRTEKEELLRKKSKVVKKFDENLASLIEDMKETMYLSQGVGIAAPQVGVLKRVFIVDIGEGPTEFVNPEILEVSGEQFGEEGCLSVPKRYGYVRRPNFVRMRAQDRYGNFFEIEGEEYMARAMLHENDHLEGTLFIDKVEGEIVEITDND